MNSTHTATFNLRQALGIAVGTVACDNNRPIWTIPSGTPIGDAGPALLEFIKELKEQLSDIYINDEYIHTDDDHFSVPDLSTGGTFSLQARYTVNDRIFFNLSQAKESYIGSSDKFEDFFVFNPTLLVDQNHEPPEEWIKFRHFFHFAETLLKDLGKVAYHNGGSEAIFVESSQSSVGSVAISTNLSEIYRIDSNIFSDIHETSLISDLAKSIENKESHYQKELAVFRCSLSELFELNQEKESANQNGIFLLKNLSRLETIHSQNFQTYISGLSLKRLKTELASEQMKLSEQASKGLMDISGKMFALPAAVGITKLVPGVGSTPGNIVIVLTCLILLLPLVSQKQQLKNIKSSNEIAFKDLDTQISNIQDQGTKSDLLEVRSNLKRTVRHVDWTLNFYILFSVLSILYIATPAEWHELAVTYCLNVFEKTSQAISALYTRIRC